MSPLLGLHLLNHLTPGTVAIKQQTPATGKMLLIAAMSCIYQPLDIVHRNAADMCFSIAYAAKGSTPSLHAKEIECWL